MIKIFNNENDALKCAEDIHNYLLENRPGYNAERWCDVTLNKSDKGEEWAVKMPIEFEKDLWSKPIDKTISLKSVKEITKYPSDWKKDTIKDDEKIIV